MTTVCVVSADDVETASERAARRVLELARAVGGVLEVLAAIYRDEDWRYLSDRAGEPYRDFGGFVRDQLGGSESNARRYRQGVETLVVPLLEIAGPGTRIPVTPNDVALLGVAGAGQVLDAAAGQLAGVDAGEARTAVIREVIDSVISDRRARAGAGEGVLAPPAPPALPESLPDSPGLRSGSDAGSQELAGGRSGAVEGSWEGPDGGGVCGRDFGDRSDRLGSAGWEPGDGERGRVDAGPVPRPGVEPVVGDRVGEDCVGDLQSVLASVLRLDPAVLADRLADTVDVGRTAHECALAAQRLARLSALLKL